MNGPSNHAFVSDVYKANMEMAHHHETQRSTITTVSFAAAGALLAVAYGKDVAAPPKAEIGLMLLVLGTVAAAVIAKQNERAQLHFQIAKECSKALEPWLAKAVSVANENQRHNHRLTHWWSLHFV